MASSQASDWKIVGWFAGICVAVVLFRQYLSAKNLPAAPSSSGASGGGISGGGYPQQQGSGSGSGGGLSAGAGLGAGGGGKSGNQQQQNLSQGDDNNSAAPNSAWSNLWDYFDDKTEATELYAGLEQGQNITQAANNVGEDPREVAQALFGGDNLDADVSTEWQPLGAQSIPLGPQPLAVPNDMSAPDASSVGGGFWSGFANALSNILSGPNATPADGSALGDFTPNDAAPSSIFDSITDPLGTNQMDFNISTANENGNYSGEEDDQSGAGTETTGTGYSQVDDTAYNGSDGSDADDSSSNDSGDDGDPGDGCFSGSTVIVTANGAIPFDSVPHIVRIRNLTGTHLAELLVHEAHPRVMIEFAPGELVTLDHLFKQGRRWVRADEFFADAPRVTYEGKVYNLRVLTDRPEDRHYWLEAGYVAHNDKDAGDGATGGDGGGDDGD
jgi:hypothetical protein